MLLKIEIILFIVLLGFPPIFSDELDDLFSEIETEIATVDREYNPLTISGEHEFKYTIPYVDLQRVQQPSFINEFTLLYSKDAVDIVSTWKLSISDEIISPLENYIRITKLNSVFQFGYSIFSWGCADKINPTDRLNEKDKSDIFDVIKIPSLSLFITQYLGDFSIEGVYIPTKTSNIEEFRCGSKINYFSNLDLSLTYIYNASLDASVDWIHNIGFSSKTTIDIFGLWVELNYSIIDSTENSLESVLGFDFNFASSNNAYLNIQAYSTWDEDFSAYLIGQLSYKLLNEELKLELNSIYNIPIEDNKSFILYKLIITFKLIESMEINLGINITNDIDNNFIANEIHQNDNIFLSIKYFW